MGCIHRWRCAPAPLLAATAASTVSLHPQHSSIRSQTNGISPAAGIDLELSWPEIEGARVRVRVWVMLNLDEQNCSQWFCMQCGFFTLLLCCTYVAIVF